MMSDDPQLSLIELTAEIVSAHVSNNYVGPGDLPALIGAVHSSLAGLGKDIAHPKPNFNPAVSIRASIKPEFIVCLEDGKKKKLLKGHLRSAHGLSPAEYRSKWGLPSDYPMVAPAYAEKRRAIAIGAGLGKKKVDKPAVGGRKKLRIKS